MMANTNRLGVLESEDREDMKTCANARTPKQWTRIAMS